MARRRQQAGLIGTAVAVHLLLLAAIPPVAASLNDQTQALQVRVALAQPPAELPSREAALPPPPDSNEHSEWRRLQAADDSPPGRRRYSTLRSSVPAAASRPAPAEPLAAEPATPATAQPAPADTGRIVGEGEFDGGPLFHSGGGSTAPGSLPQLPADPQGVPGGTGAAPAPALPPAPAAPAVDTDRLLKDYSSAVIGRIKAQQRYPSSAERDGVEGKVKVSFTLGADGALLSSSISSSSGSSELDSAALAAVKAAAPFAAIPAGLNRSSAKLSVTLNFYLR